MGLAGFNRMRREQAEKNKTMTDGQIRARAKELKIKSYHVKKIERLKKEIAEIEQK